MLEKCKGKEVRMLVSSDSGAGTGTGASYIVSSSSIVTITGTINDFDNKFLEIKNSRLSYIGIYNETFRGLGGKEFEPIKYENDITLVNIDKIINISIL